MGEIRNERLKLLASYLNIVAAGSMVATLVTEPFTWSVSGRNDLWSGAVFVLISFAVSVVFHSVAQIVLGRLKP